MVNLARTEDPITDGDRHDCCHCGTIVANYLLFVHFFLMIEYTIKVHFPLPFGFATTTQHYYSLQ